MLPVRPVTQTSPASLNWLTLAVFVLLMAFFAMLNASTLPDPARIKQALNSVSTAFGVDDMALPPMLAEGPSGRDGTGDGEGLALLSRTLAATNDPLTLSALGRDGVITFSVPLNQLTEQVPDGNKPRWMAVLADWLKSDPLGQHTQIDLMFAPDTDRALMGNAATGLVSAGIRENRLSIGVQHDAVWDDTGRVHVMVRPIRDYARVIAGGGVASPVTATGDR